MSDQPQRDSQLDSFLQQQRDQPQPTVGQQEATRRSALKKGLGVVVAIGAIIAFRAVRVWMRRNGRENRAQP